MTKTSKTPGHFWAWIGDHRVRLEKMFKSAQERGALSNKDEKFLNELMLALHRFDERLFPFGGIAPDGSYELIVTAESNVDAFPRVFELIKAAPQIEGWRFIALKPGQDASGPLSMDGISLNLNALRYVLNRTEDPPFLMLLAEEDVTAEDNWEAYQFLASVAAETILGEYVAATRIGGTGVVGLAEFTKRWGHDGSPIEDLAKEFAQVSN